MTVTNSPRTAPSFCAARRSDFELAVDQVRGIAAWTQAHRATDEVLAGLSRQDGPDLTHHREVVARQRQALRGWTAQQLHADCTPAYSLAPARAVIAHRHASFRAAVAGALQAGGVAVVADLDNGADTLGIAVAEQPDLLLVEDELPMVYGPELCRAVTRWAPRTVVAVQVTEDRPVGAWLDAGAAAVFTRRMPSADVASQLLQALTR